MVILVHAGSSSQIRAGQVLTRVAEIAGNLWKLVYKPQTSNWKRKNKGESKPFSFIQLFLHHTGKNELSCTWREVIRACFSPSNQKRFRWTRWHQTGASRIDFIVLHNEATRQWKTVSFSAPESKEKASWYVIACTNSAITCLPPFLFLTLRFRLSLKKATTFN